MAVVEEKVIEVEGKGTGEGRKKKLHCRKEVNERVEERYFSVLATSAKAGS